MKHLRSITSIFLYTVLIAILPAMFLTVFSAYESGEESMRQSESTLENTASLLASQNQQVVERTRAVLMTLAKFKLVKNLNAAQLPPVFYNLTSISPLLTDIRLCDLKGNTLASSTTPTIHLSEEQRELILLDIKNPIFAIQPSTESPTTGDTVLTCTYPVYNDKEYIAVLVAEIKMQAEAQYISDLKSIGNFDIKLIDSRNVIVFAKHTLNQNESFFAKLFNIIKQEKNDSGHIAQPGSEINSYYQRLRISSFSQPFLTVIISTDHQNTIDSIHSLIMQNSKILITLAVVASFISWAIFYLAFIRPTKRLQNFAKEIQLGHMQATDLGSPPMITELAILFRAFNTMLEALAIRTADLTLAQENAVKASSAKSEFLANMSHEIRTPMNAILGLAYLTLRTHLTQQQRNYISKIQSQAQDLLEIINNILDFSKLEAGKTTTEHISFNLYNSIRDTLYGFRKQSISKNIKWIENIDSTIPPVLLGDPHLVNQIFANYLSNAVKYTSTGSVSFTSIVLEKTDKNILMRFIIEDTGKGLSKEELENYFSKKFHDPLTELGKTSLTLSLTARLIDLLGGELSASSIAGQGSKIIIELPFAVASHYNLAALLDKRCADAPILILDSANLKSSGLVHMLQDFRLKSEIVGSSEEVLHILKTQELAHPLVIIDIMTANKNKGEFIKAIKNMNLNIAPKVIALADGGTFEAGTAASQSNADFVLYFPLNPSTLFNTLQEALLLSCPEITLYNYEEQDYEREGSKLGGVKILIVEDNLINQQIAEEILSDAGAVTSTANNGQEALDILSAKLPEVLYDIILMDLQMPVLDGFQATKAVRQQLGLKTIPIIAMTAHTRANEWESCAAAGMTDYATKPIEVDSLFETILKHVQK